MHKFNIYTAPFSNSIPSLKTVLRLLVTVMIIGSCPTVAKAAKHYIVAFDRAVPLYSSTYTSTSMLRNLNDFLEQAQFNKNKDYISVVGYSLSLQNPDMAAFVRPYHDDNRKPVIWRTCPNKSSRILNQFFSDWPYSHDPSVGESPASVQSLARPYLVKAASLSAGKEANGDVEPTPADRTFIIMVTDEAANGTEDYTKEWATIANAGYCEPSVFASIKDDVFGTVSKFYDNFKVVDTGLRKLLSADGKYKIVLYELLPNARPSMYSVTNIPSQVLFSRVYQGWEASFEPSSTSPDYELLSVHSYMKGDSSTYRIWTKLQGTSKMEIALKSRDIRPGDSLLLETRIRFVDGIYDGAVLLADVPAFRSGMQTAQRLQLLSDTKIMGVWTLSDSFWFWFHDDLVTAVLIWDLIIILAFIALIVIMVIRVLNRINHYRPSNRVLKIEKI